MAKRNKVVKALKEKTPSELAGSDGVGSIGENISSSTNPTTNMLINQQDYSETQDFQADESKYVKPLKNEARGHHWLFIVYPESAPNNWEYQLEQTGIPFVVSPLHEYDHNPDGSPKKAHYHVIVSYSQNTAYSTVIGLREITHGPYPLKCGSVSGSYAYLTHRNNPEKYQYDAVDIRRFNGWERELEANDVAVIKAALTRMCLIEDIQNYSELMVEVMDMDGDYRTVAERNTFYFKSFLDGYRHAPIRTLMRFYGKLETDEERKRIRDRIDDIRSSIEERKGWYNEN